MKMKKVLPDKVLPDVVFYHKDYQKVVQEIKFEQGFWGVSISLLVILFGGDFVSGGGKSFVPLFVGAAVFAVVVMARVRVDLDRKYFNFDPRDLCPWNWGVVPPDHSRFSQIRGSILKALEPLNIGAEVFSMVYGEYRAAVDEAVIELAVEVVELENLTAGGTRACIKSRENFNVVLSGLLAQGEGCLIPLGVENYRRHYFQAAKERLAKK